MKLLEEIFTSDSEQYSSKLKELLKIVIPEKNLKENTVHGEIGKIISLVQSSFLSAKISKTLRGVLLTYWPISELTALFSDNNFVNVAATVTEKIVETLDAIDDGDLLKDGDECVSSSIKSTFLSGIKNLVNSAVSLTEKTGNAIDKLSGKIIAPLVKNNNTFLSSENVNDFLNINDAEYIQLFNDQIKVIVESLGKNYQEKLNDDQRMMVSRAFLKFKNRNDEEPTSKKTTSN